MIRLLLMVLVSLVGRSLASVTAAWKVPISHFAADYQTGGKARKLEKAPGESAFFKEGDELWDVSGALAPIEVFGGDNGDPFSTPTEERSPEWKGEWLVWNARSGMVVARGSWADILHAEKRIRFRELPSMCRTKLELITGDAEGQVPGTRPLSGINRSGDESSIRIDGADLRWTVTEVGSASPYLYELALAFSWESGPKDSKWEVSTTVSLEDEKRTRLARHGVGKDSWEIYASVSSESIDGAPMSQARFLEGPEGLKAWPIQRHNMESTVKPLASGLYAASYETFDEFHRLAGELPFTDAPDIEAPAELAEWIRGPVLDLSRPLAERGGLDLRKPGRFAVFDPRTARMGLMTDRRDLDNFQSAIEQMCCLGYPSIWIETNPECGNWGLANRSGEKSSIVKTGGDGKEEAYRLEITIGADNTTIDLRYIIDFPAPSGGFGRLDSATTVHQGTPQALGSYFSGDRETKLKITASENRP